MGMGWTDTNYSYKREVRKCKCGKGKIIEIRHITEESEYPPFERGEIEIKSTCPDNCENNNGHKFEI